ISTPPLKVPDLLSDSSAESFPHIGCTMRSNVFATMALLGFGIGLAQAIDPPKTEEAIRHEIAVAEFTQKMKDANYPALFDAAAAEFHVPPDVLKGVSLAETRWDHLEWP